MVDYQGNSKKEREAKENPKPEKKLEKVVTGEVIQKKPGVGRKFHDVFFGGDLKSAMEFVAMDVLLPAARDMFIMSIWRGMESWVRGDTYRRPPPRDYRDYGPISRTQYNNPLQNRTVVEARSYARLPDQTPVAGRWRERNRPRANDIIIVSRQEAEEVLRTLCDVIEKYELVSVADFYEVLGLESDQHTDNKWGWSYLNNVPIRQVSEGYVIDLPPAEPI